jgi:hypothetical protein
MPCGTRLPSTSDAKCYIFKHYTTNTYAMYISIHKLHKMAVSICNKMDVYTYLEFFTSLFFSHTLEYFFFTVPAVSSFLAFFVV